MARRGVLGAIAAALLLGGAAAARDVTADAPYPMTAPAQQAARAHRHPHHAAKAPAAPVPLPRSADRGTAAADKPVDVPLPRAAPAKPADVPAALPKFAALPLTRPEPPKLPTAVERPDDVFAGIPAGERLQLQAALLWAGDFTGTAGSDDPMRTAVRNFQKRIKAKVTGIPSAEERARLLAAAREHEETFGWKIVTDPATGIRIGLPAKLTPLARDTAHGTRWSSAHGEIDVETFRLKHAKLDAVFDAMKRVPANRKVETSALRGDGFVISGMQGLKYFAVRAKMRDGEVRGFTLRYDQAMEGIVAPVAAAMANAFTPFPERAAPFAALARAVDYGSGIVVSTHGHIVTTARLADGCRVLLAAGLGHAERIAEDKAHGLALLRVYGRHSPNPVVLAAAARPGEVRLVGIPDPREQNGANAPIEVNARVTAAGGIDLRRPAPMAGLAGAAAIDTQGSVIGIAALGTAVVAMNEPAIAPVRLVSAAAIRDLLGAQGVTPTAATTGDAKSAVVRIICVRQ